MSGSVGIRISPRDLKGLQRAIRRNPRFVKEESGKFMARAKAEYLKVILRNPWEVGQRGGGAPKDTGHLRDTHRTKVAPYRMTITPEPSRRDPNYADFVHGGTRVMKKRPWLDYAMKQKKGTIESMASNMLGRITKRLGE